MQEPVGDAIESGVVAIVVCLGVVVERVSSEYQVRPEKGLEDLVELRVVART